MTLNSFRIQPYPARHLGFLRNKVCSIFNAIVSDFITNPYSTIAVAIWSGEAVSISPQLSLTLDDYYVGGVGGVTTDNPGYAEVFANWNKTMNGV
jgi:hypothetical protein